MRVFLSTIGSQDILHKPMVTVPDPGIQEANEQDEAEATTDLFAVR
jgi:hypothetical protein